MCEMLAISSPVAVPIADILEWSCLLDELGVAGFGWGLVWTDGETLHHYRSVDGIRKDSIASRALRGVTWTRGFVHLRRPSLMSTIGHVNAQPYVSQDRDWAFAHNGFLKQHRDFRAQYQDDLRGTSDSEVGFQYWLRRLSENPSLTGSLIETHQALGGNANFMALHRRGDLAVYAGNEENPVYTFEMNGIRIASTSLHSHDNFLFEAVFPGASRIEHLPPGTAHLMP